MSLGVNGRFGLTGATVMVDSVGCGFGGAGAEFRWLLGAGCWNVGRGSHGLVVHYGCKHSYKPPKRPEFFALPGNGGGGVSEQKKGDGSSLEWLKERSQICGARPLRQGQPSRLFRLGTVPGGSGVY